MEFLKVILGDSYEQFATTINTYNEANKDKQVKLADLGSGEYVSVAKYKSLETELAGVKETIKTHEGTIDTLKKANKDNESDVAKKNEEIKNLKIDFEIQNKLKDTKHVKLLIHEFDRSKIVLTEDGTATGIDEQVTTLKDTYKDLFTPVVKGTEPNNNGGGVPNGKNPWSKASYNLTEQGKLLRDNPELAKQYMASAN